MTTMETTEDPSTNPEPSTNSDPSTKPEPKRIAIYLDGTWNDERDKTNIWKLKEMTVKGSPDQLVKYCTGVGTHTSWWRHYTSGLLGLGMTNIIKEAYDFLVHNYNPGDHVYVFGFSRGGFETRGLIGLLDICGLWNPETWSCTEKEPFHQLWQHYELVHLDEHVQTLYQLLHLPPDQQAALVGTEAKMVTQCKPIKIQFVGLFDVVAADPKSKLHKYGQNPATIRRVVHAMSIDELRGSFKVMHCKMPPPKLATRSLGSSFHSTTLETVDDDVKARSFMEQRWFVGVHSHVGGGFSNEDVVANVPLRWVQQCAMEEGLKFHTVVELRGDEHLVPPAHLEVGWFQWIMRLGHNHYREIGLEKSVNETIDKTVFERFQNKECAYAPVNLIQWAEKHKDKGIDLNTMAPHLMWAELGKPCVEKPKSS